MWERALYIFGERAFQIAKIGRANALRYKDAPVLEEFLKEPVRRSRRLEHE